LFCDNTINEKDDPRKLSSFIEDVMDPYGRQDKYLKEAKEIDEKKRKKDEEQKKQLEKSQKDNEKYKKMWDEIKKTKSLLKDNISLTEQLYDNLEKGELIKSEKKEYKTNGFLTLKKNNIVKLFGYKMKPDMSNIKLIAEELLHHDSDEEKKSKHSDSSNSLMDFDVVCNEQSQKIN